MALCDQAPSSPTQTFRLTGIETDMDEDFRLEMVCESCFMWCNSHERPLVDRFEDSRPHTAEGQSHFHVLQPSFVAFSSEFQGYLAKSLNWDQYNNLRVGRHPQLHFNRITEPAKDLHLQDIKASSLQSYNVYSIYVISNIILYE